MSLKAKYIILELANKYKKIMPIQGDAAIKLKKVSVNFLSDVLNTCEKHGLKPFVAYGTALGAYRHKGFIPWDDDIDIAMSRADYNYLREHFDDMFGGKFEYEAPKYGDKDTNTHWGKIYLPNTSFVEIFNVSTPYNKGIFIDVFPIDGLSDNNIIRWFDLKIASIMRFISNSMNYYNYPNDIMDEVMSYTIKTNLYLQLRKFIGFCFSWVSHKTWCSWYDTFISRHTSSQYTIITYEDGISKRGAWLNFKKIPFEDIFVNVPEKIEEYLSQTYGTNYMQLPPLDKREQHFCVKLEIFGETLI